MHFDVSLEPGFVGAGHGEGGSQVHPGAQKPTLPFVGILQLSCGEQSLPLVQLL
jgi:hypothetical protein